MAQDTVIRSGMKANWKQFSLLVIVNAFVGSMVGLERAVIPGFAKEAFHINANTALLSFIAAFGISKALSNLLMGKLSRRMNRKNVLLTGWLVALPVPFLLMYATSWEMVIAANILLGINQGLAWSSTVIMKIDLVGQKNRGLAMGINEFAGYLAVGVASYLAAGIAADYGYSFFPFIPGIIFSVLAVLLVIFFVKDTTPFMNLEAEKSNIPILKNVWKEVSYKHPNLGSITISGLVNNMNDGVVWGLLPVLLIQRNYTISEIGIFAGIYPAVWGLSQLITGKLGDTLCKKQIISSGMWLQAIALVLLVAIDNTVILVLSSILLGIGTAMVYPNFLTVSAENTNPVQRAESMSIFRFWRDSGYVFGALISGFMADQFGLASTFIFVALLTAASGIMTNRRMCCTNKLIWKAASC